MAIQLRRGLKSEIPTEGAEGEPLFCKDSKELFFGMGAGQPLVGMKTGFSTIGKIKGANNTRKFNFHLPERQDLGVSVPAPTPSGAFSIIQRVEYFTIIKAQGLISNPLDKYYAYVATHDDNCIWLITAPTVMGEWTWRQKILTTSTPNVGAAGHISSPYVIFKNGKFLLYYHGHYSTTGGQATYLATSTDGVTYTPYSTSPVVGVGENEAKWDARARTYLRVVDMDTYLIGFTQCNSAGLTHGGGAWVNQGYAVSRDGFRWYENTKQPLAYGTWDTFGFNLFGYFMLNQGDITKITKDPINEPLTDSQYKIIPKVTTTSPREVLWDEEENKLYFFYVNWGSTDGVMVSCIDWGAV